MFNIPCIIFAGGKSSRMGEDKSLLPFGNYSTLTEYQYTRLSKIFTHVYISCKNREKFPFTANFIEDDTDVATYAPTAGFLASFRKLQLERFFVISVDTPFVAEKEINKLLQADTTSVDATIASIKTGIQPMCGIYHRSLYEAFVTMNKTGNHKLGFLLKNSNVTFVTCEDETAFANLNYPHEYEEALKRII